MLNRTKSACFSRKGLAVAIIVSLVVALFTILPRGEDLEGISKNQPTVITLQQHIEGSGLLQFDGTSEDATNDLTTWKPTITPRAQVDLVIPDEFFNYLPKEYAAEKPMSALRFKVTTGGKLIVSNAGTSSGFKIYLKKPNGEKHMLVPVILITDSVIVKSDNCHIWDGTITFVYRDHELEAFARVKINWHHDASIFWKEISADVNWRLPIE